MRREKPIQQKQKLGIDATLTKVTYGKYATRVPDEVGMESTSGLVPSKTLSSI